MNESGNSLYRLRQNGYVYAARDQDGNIKIGACKVTEKRIRQLRTKSRLSELTLVLEIKSKRYMYLETFLHFELEEYKIKREWFYCKDESAIFKKIDAFISKHGDAFGVEYQTRYN
jgi:hypothetical protein